MAGWPGRRVGSSPLPFSPFSSRLVCRRAAGGFGRQTIFWRDSQGRELLRQAMAEPANLTARQPSTITDDDSCSSTILLSRRLGCSFDRRLPHIRCNLSTALLGPVSDPIPSSAQTSPTAPFGPLPARPPSCIASRRLGLLLFAPPACRAALSSEPSRSSSTRPSRPRPRPRRRRSRRRRPSKPGETLTIRRGCAQPFGKGVGRGKEGDALLVASEQGRRARKIKGIQ